MNNKEIFYFTGKCLTLDEHPEFRTEIIDRCKSDQIDWQQFVFLCSNHLILPVIYLKFKSHGIIEYLPEELSEHLVEVYELNFIRNNRILKQLHSLTKTLNKSNIYPVFLKGAGNLLDGLYADIGERILGDIDFLVPEKDYLISAKLMESEGYSKVLITPDYTDIKNSKHYPRLSHPDFAAVIEIHRIPVRENYLSWFNSTIIDQEKRTIAAIKGCYILSNHHKITHNFIHSQLSNSGHAAGIVSLRDLYDLYLLSKRSSIVETTPKNRNKQKAIAYFALARLILGLDESFYFKKNLSFRILLKKHSLNLSSATFYNTNRNIRFLFQHIVKEYIGQLIKSFYSKKVRQSVISRIRSRNWYGDHLRLYIHFFKKNQ
ncbi:MAG TPA: nucleotidyltransferase family protein [Prolixibacteraceae bacterium]|nr:nucleotidyltransferase family protein [Prolixibacteraceae bacterium]